MFRLPLAEVELLLTRPLRQSQLTRKLSGSDLVEHPEDARYRQRPGIDGRNPLDPQRFTGRHTPHRGDLLDPLPLASVYGDELLFRDSPGLHQVHQVAVVHRSEHVPGSILELELVAFQA